MTTILWRYADSPSASGAEDFSDESAISSYASAAVDWASMNSIVPVISSGVFAPRSNATRAQIAAALMNYTCGTDTQQPTPESPGTVSGDLVRISGGTFQMGSPANEPERSSDEVQHSVTVSSFYMAKTEVSLAAYQAIMGSNPSETTGDSLPVTNITWYDAVQYCNKRSEAEGLTPCYTVSGTTVTWDKTANGYRSRVGVRRKSEYHNTLFFRRLCT